MSITSLGGSSTADGPAPEPVSQPVDWSTWSGATLTSSGLPWWEAWPPADAESEPTYSMLLAAHLTGVPHVDR